jgi:hypothetical protein
MLIQDGRQDGLALSSFAARVTHLSASASVAPRSGPLPYALLRSRGGVLRLHCMLRAEAPSEALENSRRCHLIEEQDPATDPQETCRHRVFPVLTW